MMNGKKPNIVKEKSFEFAVEIVKCYKCLCEEKKEFTLSKQLLRSGTSVGANVREAINAESPKDFIHKLSIAQKECDESVYWLELLMKTSFLDKSHFENISSQAKEVLKIIKSIILTMKQKYNL